MDKIIEEIAERIEAGTDDLGDRRILLQEYRAAKRRIADLENFGRDLYEAVYEIGDDPRKKERFCSVCGCTTYRDDQFDIHDEECCMRIFGPDNENAQASDTWCTAWDLLGDHSEHEGGFRVKGGRVKWERAHYKDGSKNVYIYRIEPSDNNKVRLVGRYIGPDTLIELIPAVTQ